MTAEPLRGPESLDSGHDAMHFDCGVSGLNGYLIDRALSDQRAEKSRTYVAARGARVVAYFSLAASSAEPADATERLARGQGGQPIPVILLARLAVDTSEQGQHLGEAMLIEALAKSAAAADAIGARAVLVHAKDASARGFYERYGFEESPTDPLHLMLLIKDVRKTLGR